VQKCISIIFILLLAFQANQALADPGAEITQNIQFGRYVIRNDNAGAALQVAYDGNVISDNAFIPVNSTAKNGIIKMSGFTPGESLLLTITFLPDPLTLTCSCSSPDFQISNFQVETTSVTADISGEAFIRFGARLVAQGGAYGDVSYSGALTVRIIVNS
jgi:hypothetical protein